MKNEPVKNIWRIYLSRGNINVWNFASGGSTDCLWTRAGVSCHRPRCSAVNGLLRCLRAASTHGGKPPLNEVAFILQRKKGGCTSLTSIPLTTRTPTSTDPRGEQKATQAILRAEVTKAHARRMKMDGNLFTGCFILAPHKTKTAALSASHSAFSIGE